MLKTLTVTLVFAVLLCMVIPVAANGQQSNLFYEKINNGTQIEITGCEKTASGYISVPAEIDGLPVVSVADEAFSGCADLTGIGIPAGVISIGWRVFYGCKALLNIDVAQGNSYFTSLDGVLFTADINTLIACPDGKTGKYTVPDNTNAIGNDAFADCALLTEIVLPHSVTAINNGAFSDCASLKLMTLPDSVISLGWSVFVNCVSLAQMRIPEGVKNIGYYTFRGCSSLKSVTIPKGVSVIGGYAFRDCVSLSSVILPAGVASVKGFAFYGCTSLSEVSFPATLTSISGYAFYGCSSLKSVTIPNSVTFIGNNVFGYAQNGEPIDGFLMACYKNSEGERYADDNGFLCVITGGLTLEVKTGAALEIKSGGFVLSRKADLTASNLLGCFVNNGAAVFRGGTRLKNDELAGTGCTVRLYDGKELLDILTLAVTGDADGSGKVETDDALVTLRAAAGITEPPVGAYLLAADVTGGGISVGDARKVLRVASKLESFEP